MPSGSIGDKLYLAYLGQHIGDVYLKLTVLIAKSPDNTFAAEITVSHVSHHYRDRNALTDSEDESFELRKKYGIRTEAQPFFTKPVFSDELLLLHERIQHSDKCCSLTAEIL